MKGNDLREVRPVRSFMGRLEHGADLLEAITSFCVEHGITLGRVAAIGAVRKAVLAYYDQTRRDYRTFELARPLEITSLLGNVSLKDGAPVVHAHVTLADEQGRAYGGHLAAGTEIFACEMVIDLFEGPAFLRSLDRETGLPLWSRDTGRAEGQDEPRR